MERYDFDWNKELIFMKVGVSWFSLAPPRVQFMPTALKVMMTAMDMSGKL